MELRSEVVSRSDSPSTWVNNRLRGINARISKNLLNLLWCLYGTIIILEVLAGQILWNWNVTGFIIWLGSCINDLSFVFAFSYLFFYFSYLRIVSIDALIYLNLVVILRSSFGVSLSGPALISPLGETSIQNRHIFQPERSEHPVSSSCPVGLCNFLIVEDYSRGGLDGV